VIYLFHSFAYLNSGKQSSHFSFGDVIEKQSKATSVKSPSNYIYFLSIFEIDLQHFPFSTSSSLILEDNKSTS